MASFLKVIFGRDTVELCDARDNAAKRWRPTLKSHEGDQVNDSPDAVAFT